MKVIYLNRFFFPDHSATSQILSELAFSLAERGVEVAIITSRLHYDDPQAQLPAYETVQSVDINRVYTSRFGRSNLVGRAFDYLTFYFFAAFKLWRLARRGDVVVVKTDPPLLSVIAAPVAFLKGAKLVNWLQDIYPEIATALGVGRKSAAPVFSVLRWFRNLTLRNAYQNVVLGAVMSDRLLKLGVSQEKIRSIPNWSDGAVVHPIDHGANCLREDWQLQDKFVVGYSGNLGRAHDISAMVTAIERLDRRGKIDGSPEVDASSIAFVYVGGGALLDTLKDQVAQRGFQNVQFYPYQPRERLAESLSVPDVHLVSLKPGLEGLVVPSKFYGIAAAGRPTIFIGDENGEIARLIKDAECGFVVAADDGAGLADLIVRLQAEPDLCAEMGKRARLLFEDHFTKEIAVGKWGRLLADCGYDVAPDFSKLSGDFSGAQHEVL